MFAAPLLAVAQGASLAIEVAADHLRRGRQREQDRAAARRALQEEATCMRKVTEQITGNPERCFAVLLSCKGQELSDLHVPVCRICSAMQQKADRLAKRTL